MGLPLSGERFFSMKHMNLPLQIFFFVIMAMVFGYYAIMLHLKAKAQLDLFGSDMASQDMKGSIPGIVHQMEASLKQVQKEKDEAVLKKSDILINAKIIEHEYQQLVDIINGLDFGILLLDTRETVFFVNPFFLNLLCLKSDQLVNRNIFDSIDHNEFISFIRRLSLFEQGNDTGQVEICFPDITPDDIYLVSAFSITDADGLTFGRLIKIMNITKEKAAVKSQSNFINHIAHELRTPLTNIRAYNEMMMDGEITDLEVQKEFFNTINDETNRLSELIKNILNLAETEIGQVVPNKEMVKTKWLVKSCIESIEAIAKEKKIELKQNLPDNLPKITGDKEMLKAALINVVGNAVKYTPEQGRVSFSVREETETILFEVEDTGYGISENDLPHIFEKFYRAKEDQVLDETGSGLGLAITEEIIKTHGGEIEVESTIGKGSRFIITLPKGNIQIG
jgi:two-component system phosphate regulon sensor histidine kinase PhoR